MLISGEAKIELYGKDVLSIIDITHNGPNIYFLGLDGIGFYIIDNRPNSCKSAWKYNNELDTFDEFLEAFEKPSHYEAVFNRSEDIVTIKLSETTTKKDELAQTLLLALIKRKRVPGAIVRWEEAKIINRNKFHGKMLAYVALINE